MYPVCTLRADNVAVPILFTSGYSRDAVYTEAILPTGISFLHKPWTLAELFQSVRGLLAAQPGRPDLPLRAREILHDRRAPNRAVS